MIDCQTEVKSLTKTDVTEGMDLNFKITKMLKLVLWVKTSISVQPNNKLRSSDMYNNYIASTNPTARVSENVFYKEIEPIMRACKLNPDRFRDREGRGYTGITIKNE